MAEDLGMAADDNKNVSEDTVLRYHRGLRLLHWLMAIVILGLIALGLIMGEVDKADPLRGQLYALHKSFGVLVLLLLAVRVIVRFLTHIPPLPDTLKVWEIKAAHAGHALLYFFMLAVPLSGYAMSAAGGHGVKMFGFSMPQIFPENKSIAGIAHEIHEVIPFVLLGVITLHVMGVVKHRLEGKDILYRMK